jgi:hypothetical protein
VSIDAITYAKTLDVDNPMSRLLLFIIAENTFNDTGLCRVGQAVLADETRASIRTVQRHVEKLKNEKVLRLRAQSKEGGGRDFDALELIGFLSWLKRARSPESEPAKSAGSPPETKRDKLAGSTPETKPDNLTGSPPETEPAKLSLWRVRTRHCWRVSYKDNPVQEKTVLERGRARAPKPSLRDIPLGADWSLPDPWRQWAIKESPEHAHLIDGEAKKFKAHFRNLARSDWEGEWQKWFLRTCERPAERGRVRRTTAANWDSGPSVRDTSEPFAEYTARMIREGKLPPGTSSTSKTRERPSSGARS